MTESRAGRGPLWRVYEAVAMVIGLGSLAILCLGWMPAALLVHLSTPRHVGQSLGRRVIQGGFRGYLWILETFCACRFDLRALDALRDAPPMVLAANHPSLLDAVLILSRLPNAVCIMKAALMDNILFGAAARLAGYIRNDAALDMIINAREALQQGAHVIVFPEGTRTVDFPVGPCLPTIGLIASRAQVPIQAILIDFSTPYLGKAWPLFRRPRLPLTCQVRLGRTFAPPPDALAFARELEQAFRDGLSSPPAPGSTPRMSHA